MPRGPQKLSDSQLALLAVARARRIARDNAREEWEIRVRKLEDEFFADHDEALRQAVWACADAQIPAARIKQVTNISDHRTYKSRFFTNYVPPVTEGWEFTVNAGYATVTRFLRFALQLQFVLQDDQVVVEPKTFSELDERDLAEQLSAGRHTDEWSMLMSDIRSKLKES